MTLKERLLKQYGVNRPIFIDEIRFEEIPYNSIRKEFSRMVNGGEIKRYMRGVYYFPARNAALTPFQIAAKRYLRRDSKPYGFYSGANLQNMLGLSTQVPFTTEITTNAVKRSRRVTVGVFRFLLLPPRVRVTNRNLSALQFLNVVERTALASFRAEDIGILSSFIKQKRIKKSVVLGIIDSYPKETLTKLQKTGLIDELT